MCCCYCCCADKPYGCALIILYRVCVLLLLCLLWCADKPRGYAFIEYEHKKDMKEAYKQSDGRKIEGRRILVDVERGRTVENW
jgi:hypothetical protein